ncbi:MAG: ATP-binding protein, partial [Desulfobacteraceae bacterium]|nr:ATP-binding protein [Desulfobacteraceae bacterium]
MENYIKRSLEPVLIKAADQFPVVVLTGPRQSGKTTLLKYLFADKYGYVSLEPPDIRAAATEDPRGFLEMYPRPVIFDEVQYAPDLLPYIKEIVDADREKKGQFLLTGSQNLLLNEQISESLAGRVAMLRLLPLSQREISGNPKVPLIWQGNRSDAKKTYDIGKKLWQGFLRGGFPELVADGKRDISLWHGSYIQTYLERDVRFLRQVGDLSQFQIFLRALAARTAQLLSLTDLSRDIGVAVNTIKAWISILEATYQVIVLKPWFTNTGKRLVKSPKIYFSDVG